MNKLTFRLKIFVFFMLMGLSSFALAITSSELSESDWKSIRIDAQNFVARESPPAVWPFARILSVKNTKKVIAHYFPAFPLSMDNKLTGQDYYQRQFLRTAGESGKYKAQRGYLRERPLPTMVWDKQRAKQTNLAIEILRAESIGIDAFGIDLLQIGKGQHWDTALMLLDTTNHVSNGFRIVPEPDMSALKNVSEDDLVEGLTIFYRHPSSYHLADGRLLVIPFLAEAVPPEFWKAVVDRMVKQGTPIAFLPDFLNQATAASYAAFSYGMTFWGGRDPNSTKSYVGAAAKFASLGKLSIMLPVASQDYRPKNSMTWEARNTENFRVQWEAVMNSGADYAHLLTWNDYSESTEISPSSGTQFLFYDLSRYYIQRFKTGKAPTIQKDALYFSFRRQIFDPQDTSLGGEMKHAGTTPLANDVEVVAMLTTPATLEIKLQERNHYFQLEAGFQVVRVPAVPGKVKLILLRNGKRLLVKESDWQIDAYPQKHDALYVGGSTSRNFITVPETIE